MQERNPFISDQATTNAAAALEQLAMSEKVESKVRLQAAQSILGAAYLYEYASPGAIDDDEPEPEQPNVATGAFDGPMSPLRGPQPAVPSGQSLSVTLTLAADADPVVTLKALAEIFGGAVVEARIGPWYG